MKQEELNGIMRRHKAWMEGKFGGERAYLHGEVLCGAYLQGKDLRHADLHGAKLRDTDLRNSDLRDTDFRHTDLRHADLRDTELRNSDLRGADLQHAILGDSDLQGADLRGADLRHSDLQRADLQHSDLRGVDLDYASWPLWCGSLKAYVDDRIAIQLLYHTLSVVQHSPYVSEDVKEKLLTPEIVSLANRFHRVRECGEIKEWEEEDK